MLKFECDGSVVVADKIFYDGDVVKEFLGEGKGFSYEASASLSKRTVKSFQVSCKT